MLIIISMAAMVMWRGNPGRPQGYDVKEGRDGGILLLTQKSQLSGGMRQRSAGTGGREKLHNEPFSRS